MVAPSLNLPHPLTILDATLASLATCESTSDAGFAGLSKAGTTSGSRAISPPPSSGGRRATSPSSGLPAAARPALLTLHLAFPHAFLDALNLLDRGAVMRLNIMRDEPVGAGRVTETGGGSAVPQVEVGTTRSADGGTHHEFGQRQAPPQPSAYALTQWHVASQQTRPARYRHNHGRERGREAEAAGGTVTHTHMHSYPVSLSAWHCACPAFTFAAFTAPTAVVGLPVVARPFYAPRKPGFGGSMRLAPADVPPVCKHLLACALADAWPAVLGRTVVQKELSWVAAAGWAAGWDAG